MKATEEKIKKIVDKSMDYFKAQHLELHPAHKIGIGVIGILLFVLLVVAVVAPPRQETQASHFNIQKIATGNSHSVALNSDGTVWAWGQNGAGTLGDGTTENKTLPTQVHGSDNIGYLTDVVDIDAGGSMSFAIKNDGTIWTWGYNLTSDSNGTIPVQVSGPNGEGFLTDVSDIAAGNVHIAALKSDGTVWTWGYNYNGSLGNGSLTYVHQPYPTQVVGLGGDGYLTGVVAIAAGSGWTIALKSDGTVWTWGGNSYGSLGDGTTLNRPYPVQVLGLGGSGFLTNIVAIDGGQIHSLALNSDGTIWGWGSNNYGQLGASISGCTGNPILLTPVQVSGVSDVLNNRAAIAAGERHSLAVKSDGTVWAWGSNEFGQLGNNGVSGCSSQPVQVSNVSNIISSSAGGLFSLVRKSDGTIWAWGKNEYGQLGDGTRQDRSTAVPVLFGDVTSPTINSATISPNISSNSITITKNVTDDASDVASVKTDIKNSLDEIIGSVDLVNTSGNTWEGTFVFPQSLPDGTYMIVDVAKDAENNTTTQTDGSVLLDRTAPTVTMAVITPPQAIVTDFRADTVNIEVSVSDTTSGVSSVAVKDLTVVDTELVALSLTGGSVEPGQTAMFSGTFNAQLPLGFHDVRVEVKDNATPKNILNNDIANAFEVVGDTTPPQLINICWASAIGYFNN